MAETRPIRYQIDFQLIPALYHKDEKAFALAFSLAPDELLAKMYTDAYKQIKPEHFWQRTKRFSKTDFTVQKKEYPDDIHIIYVSLPPMNDGSHVYCTAYALVLGPKDVSLYTVEKSVFGTTCIGTVDEKGNHINMGEAGSSIEENMDILHRLSAGEDDKPTIETRKAIHSDGTYSEIITDNESKRAEIHVYDVEGNCVERVYGTFADEPEISDEEFDEYIASLENEDSKGSVDCLEKELQETDEEASAIKAETYLEKGNKYWERKEYENAMPYFLKAAELGNAVAQNRVGLMYLQGEGTPVDYEKARFYFEKASKGGLDVATHNLHSINRELEHKEKMARLGLTPESIAELHHVSVRDVQIGKTPNGGVYTIVAEGGGYVSFTEYDENHNEVFRTSGYIGNQQE